MSGLEFDPTLGTVFGMGHSSLSDHVPGYIYGYITIFLFSNPI